MTDLVALGSATARSGFQNERDMCCKFDNWRSDQEARQWLQTMGYNLQDISHVRTQNIPQGHKTDVQIEINCSFKIYTENLSLKRVKEGADFNQIDKRWVDSYYEMWRFNERIRTGLKMFTGEIRPETLLRNNTISRDLFNSLRDNRRFFLDELPGALRQEIVDFFRTNKPTIVSDLLKGRDRYAANWMLVTKYNPDNNTVNWVLRDIESALRIFGDGSVQISPRGSLYIGSITMQRKGGDGGRDTANMLQFKASPCELFK